MTSSIKLESAGTREDAAELTSIPSLLQSLQPQNTSIHNRRLFRKKCCHSLGNADFKLVQGVKKAMMLCKIWAVAKMFFLIWKWNFYFIRTQNRPKQHSSSRTLVHPNSYMNS